MSNAAKHQVKLPGPGLAAALKPMSGETRYLRQLQITATLCAVLGVAVKWLHVEPAMPSGRQVLTAPYSAGSWH